MTDSMSGPVESGSTAIRMLVRLARRLKGDDTFSIDPGIKTGDLLGLLWRRGVMALRGVVLAMRTGHWAFPVFVGRGVRVSGARHLYLSPAVTIDDYCRLDCVSRKGVRLGRGVTLRQGAQIEATSVMRDIGEGALIGDRVGISEGCFIAAKGEIHIGSDTIIGPGTRIIAENHVFESRTDTVQSQGVTRRGIRIGHDCWLGTNVTVLDGTSIGEGAVVGACALVNKDVEPFMVAVGVPARAIGSR